MEILIVGGTFDRNGGKPSKIIDALAKSVIDFTMDESNGLNPLRVSVINGGNLSELTDSDSINFREYDALFWAPNISNDEAKIIPDIKSRNPKLLLISSKRVVEKEYTEADIIGRLLKTKSNLGLMITKPGDRYHFKLLDPLGNCYSDRDNIADVATAMMARVQKIYRMTRNPSKNIGEARDFQINPAFVEFIKHSASEFTKHVNAVNPNRLLGNASTRCMFGFPAERTEGRMFVTQRNIDKQLIDTNGFVEINPDEESVVEFYGDKKPSVDTPIQIRLFNYYPNINYMVHGHVYVEGAKTTHSKVPCGYLEEFDEIVALYPDRNEKAFAVNLRGHGCMLLAETVEDLWKMNAYISRDFPEY